MERLFVAADGTPYGLVVRLAALTGARQGELLSLRWRHMDWGERRLTVPGTKTVASAHVVDLGPTAMELLSRQRTTERAKRLKLGPGANCGKDDATIFTNIVGKPVDAGGLKRTWRRIVRDAAVGHVRCHDLRHASATYLLQAGVPVQVVSERLGHTRTSTTTDFYAHVMPGMGREAALALEKQMVKGAGRLVVVETKRDCLVPNGTRIGALGGIRTPDPRFRRPMLYPLSYERALERKPLRLPLTVRTVARRHAAFVRPT